MNVIDASKQHIRAGFVPIARSLDRLTGSRLTPNMVTMTALVAHLPIAYLLYHGDWQIGGLLVIVFGLFDTLDGALAKVQNNVSERGMFLDASTDRLKEMLIFVGLTGWFAYNNLPWAAVLAVAACGLSQSVSYVKAKGEAAIAIREAANASHTTQEPKVGHQKLNRMFGEGLGSYEIRITILAVSILLAAPEYAMPILVVLGVYTVSLRMIAINKALS